MRRLAALLLLLPIAPAALAAESYDACVGFIDTLPATVSTQGTWCLRKDLSTAITGGAAITIATNNVTIDCNGFKLGGLGGGPESFASGVYASNRLNATVRNCAVRGFHSGVSLVGSNSAGHLVEDNRIDQSLSRGIGVEGDGNLVQRNRIFDSGNAESGAGIVAEADIRDNTIDGVNGEFTTGINASGPGTEVRGNRIRNLRAHGVGDAYGIQAFGGNQTIIDNRIMGTSEFAAPGWGIYGSGGPAFCRDNLTANILVGMFACEDNGGNVFH